MKTLKVLLPGAVAVVLAALLLLQVGIATRARTMPASSRVVSWSWAFHPQDLKEMYDLADLVVVAQVIDVRAGPEFVAQTTSPDHPTEVWDTTLIDVSSITALKGDAEPGSTVTIHRLVSINENTGRKKHTPGETYLLFLHYRDDANDGSYFIPAAEANYRIENGRLVWSWAELADRGDSFASQLDGQELDTVVQQINSFSK